MSRRVLLLLAVIVLPSASAQAPDPVLAALQGFDPAATAWAPIVREKVTTSQTILVAVSLRHALPEGFRAGVEYQRAVGLFVETPRDVSTLWVWTTEMTGFIDAVRVTPTEALLWLSPEKGCGSWFVKYFYDLDERRFLGERSGVAPGAAATAVVEGRPWLIAQAGQRFLGLRAAPGGFEPVELPPDVALPDWSPTLPACGVDHVSFDPRVTWDIVRFGPEERFILRRRPLESWSVEKLIVEEGDAGARDYPLETSNWEAFRRARPERVAQGYRPGSTFVDEIGPYQVVDGRLWFGKTFYDGEGHTGIGGLGWFDPAERAYTLVHPPEIADFSVSALLVEPDAVWMGLKMRGEWGDDGGGLARWDRTSRAVRRWPEAGFVVAVARDGERMLLGLGDGAAILENGQVRRYYFDPTLDGEWVVRESPKAE